MQLDMRSKRVVFPQTAMLFFHQMIIIQDGLTKYITTLHDGFDYIKENVHENNNCFQNGGYTTTFKKVFLEKSK